MPELPVRKDSAGREVNVQAILESIENSPYMRLGDAIQKHDRERFEEGYRFFLEGCYSCHKASEKPFLVPRVPEEPATRIINFDPGATWPR